jgi:hypothetical protein
VRRLLVRPVEKVGVVGGVWLGEEMRRDEKRREAFVSNKWICSVCLSLLFFVE